MKTTITCRNSVIITVLIYLLTGITESKVFAQFAAPNSNCDNAILLIANNSEITNSYFGDLLNTVTGISPVPACTGTSNGEHWFKFVATGSTHIVHEENLSNLQAFTGSCGALTSLGCSAGESLTLTGLTAGLTYYLRNYYSGTISPASYHGYKISILSPVTNDECAGAVTLLPVANHQAETDLREFHNYGASASLPGPPSGNNDDDVWFQFVATKGTHIIYIPIASIHPNATILKQLFSGSCGSLVSSSSFSTETATFTGLSIGTTYYVRVFNTGNNTLIRNTFSIAILELATNDECNGADTLVVNPTPDCAHSVLMNRKATTQSSVPCGTGINDVWYIFQATTPEIIVTVQGVALTSALDITVFSGSCGALNCINASSNSTDVFTGLIPGDYYYVKVDGSSNTNDELLCISSYINNDECADAITLPVNASLNEFNFIRTTNYGSTQTFPSCLNGTSAARDVWYKFTATGPRHLINASYAVSTSMYWEVFSGNCGSLTSIRCKTNTGLTDTVTGLTAGTDYYLRVFSSAADRFFSLAVINFGNDDCSGAINILPAPTPAYDKTLLYSTEFASESQPGCISAADDDVWFKFTAATSSQGLMLIHTGVSTTLDFVVEVFSGNCTSLTSIACGQSNDDYIYPYTVSGLVPGQTYYLRIHSPTAQASSRINSFLLHIVNKPVNDDIGGAIELPVTPSGITLLESYFSHGSTQSFGKFCTGNTTTPDHDTWYYFVATGAAHTIRVSNLNTFYNYFHGATMHRIEAFDGFAADSATLASKLYGCNWNPYAFSNLNAGDTVYFRVFSGGFQNTTAFGVSVENSQTIDEPQDAILLSLTNKMAYVLNTNNASQSLPPADCINTDYADDDVWVKFVANPQAKRIVINFENKDLTAELFSGIPGSLTSLKCADNILLLPNNLTNGTTYYVRIYSKKNAVDLTFHIGLFDNADITVNSCVDPSCIGTNLIPNPTCEFSDQGFIKTPSFSNANEGPGTPLCDSWFSINAATSDWLDADTYFDAFEDAPSLDYAGSGTTDFFTRTVVPRGGKGHLGIFKDGGAWYEYVSTPLTQPLIPGKHYLVSFYTSPDNDNSPLVGLGASFTVSKPLFDTYNRVPLPPHITSPPDQPLNQSQGWMNVCGIFTADQPYEFLTIGFFKNTGITSPFNFVYTANSYYFIDDVIVSEIPDSCFFTGLSENEPEDKSNNGKLHIYPNPSKNTATISWETNADAPEYIIVSDVQGKQLKRIEIATGTALVSLNTEQLSNGVYVVMGKSKSNTLVQKLVVQH